MAKRTPVDQGTLRGIGRLVAERMPDNQEGARVGLRYATLRTALRYVCIVGQNYATELRYIIFSYITELRYFFFYKRSSKYIVLLYEIC